MTPMIIIMWQNRGRTVQMNKKEKNQPVAKSEMSWIKRIEAHLDSDEDRRSKARALTLLDCAIGRVPNVEGKHTSLCKHKRHTLQLAPNIRHGEYNRKTN